MPQAAQGPELAGPRALFPDRVVRLEAPADLVHLVGDLLELVGHREQVVDVGAVGRALVLGEDLGAGLDALRQVEVPAVALVIVPPIPVFDRQGLERRDVERELERQRLACRPASAGRCPARRGRSGRRAPAGTNPSCPCSQPSCVPRDADAQPGIVVADPGELELPKRLLGPVRAGKRQLLGAAGFPRTAALAPASTGSRRPAARSVRRSPSSVCGLCGPRARCARRPGRPSRPSRRSGGSAPVPPGRD